LFGEVHVKKFLIYIYPLNFLMKDTRFRLVYAHILFADSIFVRPGSCITECILRLLVSVAKQWKDRICNLILLRNRHLSDEDAVY